MTSETSDKEINVNLQLSVTSETKLYLKTAARWSYFLSIIGFIGIFFLIIISLTIFGLSTIKNEYSDFQNLPINFPFSLIGVLYLLLALLYFFPTYNLLQFGSKIKSALETNNQLELEVGLKNLKRMFTFIGVLTIISITISLLLIPIGLIVKSLMIS